MWIIKRLGRTVIEFIASKKGMALIGALASGVPPKVAIPAYIVGQGLDDMGQGPKDKDGRRVGKPGTSIDIGTDGR